ncbi:hypothetical protein ACFYYM_37635 [Streptomyces erythrochromogenes]|uniref:hypothetical protein n=1 Tax=Streptomyces erythrochromogenes TaxID=285574 RepID=UPI0036AF1DB7
MPRQRVFRGRPRANRLAEFLCRLIEPQRLTVRDLAARFEEGPSASTWATYLNGTQIIPRSLLHRLLESTASDPRMLPALQRDAAQLWREADRESRRPETEGEATHLVRLHEQLTDALAGQARAQDVAAKASAALAELRQMGAYLESVVGQRTVELAAARDRERAEIEYQLTQARARLERTNGELERARRRRFTAEQAQQALAREANEAHEQILRLREKAAQLTSPEPAALAVPRQTMRMEDLDHRLDLISDDATAEDELLADLVDQARLDLPGGKEVEGAAVPVPRVVSGSLVASRPGSRSAATVDATRMSGTMPDNVAASGARFTITGPEASRKGLLAHLAGTMHTLNNQGTAHPTTRLKDLHAPVLRRLRRIARSLVALIFMLLANLPYALVLMLSVGLGWDKEHGTTPAGWIVAGIGGPAAGCFAYFMLRKTITKDNGEPLNRSGTILRSLIGAGLLLSLAVPPSGGQ